MCFDGGRELDNRQGCTARRQWLIKKLLKVQSTMEKAQELTVISSHLSATWLNEIMSHGCERFHPRGASSVNCIGLTACQCAAFQGMWQADIQACSVRHSLPPCLF